MGVQVRPVQQSPRTVEKSLHKVPPARHVEAAVVVVVGVVVVVVVVQVELATAEQT